MQGLFLLSSAIVGGIAFVIYHKVFNVVYFGSDAIFRKIMGFFLIGMVITGLTGGLLLNLFKVVFRILKWLIIPIIAFVAYGFYKEHTEKSQ